MLRVRRLESGRINSPSFLGTRERFVIPFRPLVLQCAINPVGGVLTIRAFVLGNPSLLDFVNETPENGAIVPGQLRGTWWYTWIAYVVLFRIVTKPTSGPDVSSNDRASLLL